MAEQTLTSALKSAPPALKRRMLILIGIGAAVLLLGISTVVWIFRVHRGSTITERVLEHARSPAAHEAPQFQFPYEIKDMSMAVMNRKGTRTVYTQFTLIFDCPSEEAKRTLDLNRAKIINAIFEVGGEFYLEDFQAPLATKGFANFKNGVADRLKTYFPKAAPRLIVLKDWVMN